MEPRTVVGSLQPRPHSNAALWEAAHSSEIPATKRLAKEEQKGTEPPKSVPASVAWPVMYPSSLQSIHQQAPGHSSSTVTWKAPKQKEAPPAEEPPASRPGTRSSSFKITRRGSSAQSTEAKYASLWNGNVTPARALPAVSLADATKLDSIMHESVGASGAPDTDVLRVCDVYSLKPSEKLAVGKYVPDPSGAPPPKSGGATTKRKGSAAPASQSSSTTTSARRPTVGSAGAAGSSLRLRRRATAPNAKSSEAKDGNDADREDAGGKDGEDDFDFDGDEKAEPLPQRPPLKAQQVIGDISDNECEDEAVLLDREGPAKVTEVSSYTVLRPIYPFPISAGTLYFPTHYADPLKKDLDDPRGLPRAINAELHGSEHDDLALHLKRRAHLQLGSPAAVMDSVTCQRGNLNKMPLYRIGPNAVAFKVVMNAFEAAGCQYTPHSNWNIMWAKRASPELLGRLGPYQKLNHFPGAWGIGRKDSLHRNIAKMKKNFGATAFDIVPPGFIVPGDLDELQEDCKLQQTEMGGKLPTYIVKPCASSCGKGIRLSEGVPTMPKGNKHVIVQRYVGNPFLVDGRKFDLRIYCVVTGFNPLKIYLFDQGLVRFAAERYPGPDADLSNTYKHLTNYSVSKTAQLAKDSKGKSADTEDPVDIKWTLTDFQKHLVELHGAEVGKQMWDTIYLRMKDVVIKAFLSIEPEVTSRLRNECRDPSGRGCFEMYGLDLMVDDRLKVYMIECNIMPSLATGSCIDKAVKARMLSHMLTMVGPVPYARRNAAAHGDDGPRGPPVTSERFYFDPPKGARRPEIGYPPRDHPKSNPPLITNFGELCDSERMMLLEADEEFSRRGGFDRIFPTANSHKKYFGLFPDGVNRNNIILASWLAMQEQKRK